MGRGSLSHHVLTIKYPNYPRPATHPMFPILKTLDVEVKDLLKTFVVKNVSLQEVWT